MEINFLSKLGSAETAFSYNTLSIENLVDNDPVSRDLLKEIQDYVVNKIKADGVDYTVKLHDILYLDDSVIKKLIDLEVVAGCYEPRFLSEAYCYLFENEFNNKLNIFDIDQKEKQALILSGLLNIEGEITTQGVDFLKKAKKPKKVSLNNLLREALYILLTNVEINEITTTRHSFELYKSLLKRADLIKTDSTKIEMTKSGLNFIKDDMSDFLLSRINSISWGENYGTNANFFSIVNITSHTSMELDLAICKLYPACIPSILGKIHPSCQKYLNFLFNSNNLEELKAKILNERLLQDNPKLFKFCIFKDS